MHRSWTAWGPRLAALAGVIVGLFAVPRLLCQAGADDFWRGDRASVEALGRNVDRHVREQSLASFSTGSRRFDGEWRFGTAMMAAMGFGQSAGEHPELAAEALLGMDRALDSMLKPEARAFDADAWHEDPLSSLGSEHGHGAYLGYLNLALSLRRFAGSEPRFSSLNDRISESLERRLERAPLHVIETYPGEIYPVDNAAAIASIALRARALGREPPALVDRWLGLLRTRFVDPSTGLLYQALGPDREPADAPRGSGTALGAYFLSFADESASLALHAALRRELLGQVAGFGVVREYARGARVHFGDIDSGPLIFGWSISAMGFAMSGCRIHAERGCFVSLYRGFHLFGAPTTRGTELTFASGGPLGNAIVFAMLTAQPAARWRRS